MLSTVQYELRRYAFLIIPSIPSITHLLIQSHSLLILKSVLSTSIHLILVSFRSVPIVPHLSCSCLDGSTSHIKSMISPYVPITLLLSYDA